MIHLKNRKWRDHFLACNESLKGENQYFVQKYGVNKIKTVNNSNLPSSIKRLSTHLPAGDILAKLSTGPTDPNPGPMLPRQVATEPTEVRKSWPSDAMSIEPMAKMMK
jgi:hypothetical protein